MRDRYCADGCGQTNKISQQFSNMVMNVLALYAHGPVPRLPALPVVVKVPRHMDRTLGVIGRNLAIPGRLQALRLRAIDERHGGLADNAEFTRDCRKYVLVRRVSAQQTRRLLPVRTKSPYFSCILATSRWYWTFSAALDMA